MSKQTTTILICDICCKPTPKEELTKIKVLNHRVLKLNGTPALRKIDICDDCVDSFKRWREYIDKNLIL